MSQKLIILLLFSSFAILAQKPSQNIRGIVLDNASNQPIAFEIPIKEIRLLIDLRGLSNISCDKEIYNRSFLVSLHFSKA